MKYILSLFLKEPFDILSNRFCLSGKSSSFRLSGKSSSFRLSGKSSSFRLSGKSSGFRLSGKSSGFCLSGKSNSFCRCGKTNGSCLCGKTNGSCLCGKTNGFCLCGKSELLGELAYFGYQLSSWHKVKGSRAPSVDQIHFINELLCERILLTIIQQEASLSSYFDYWMQELFCSHPIKKAIYSTFCQ